MPAVTPRDALDRTISSTHKPDRNNQVSKIVSGPPASICSDAATAAIINFRPPNCQALSTVKTTQGIQLRVATWLGHISMFKESPLNANTTPATDAARLFPVHRRASEYIPIPAKNRWSKQNKLNDQVRGSAR